jgi:hypothetical protein
MNEGKQGRKQESKEGRKKGGKERRKKEGKVVLWVQVMQGAV